MSVVSDRIRATIVSRAGDRCEYCHTPTAGQVATFPIDHVIPSHMGGLTNRENLALACPSCNGHKWIHIDGQDVKTGEMVRLFNPRTEVWTEHFAWSNSVVGALEGRTTIQRLQMNAPDMVKVRQFLAQVGLFAEPLE